jgi:hypothetical protein
LFKKGVPFSSNDTITFTVAGEGSFNPQSPSMGGSSSVVTIYTAGADYGTVTITATDATRGCSAHCTVICVRCDIVQGGTRITNTTGNAAVAGVGINLTGNVLPTGLTVSNQWVVADSGTTQSKAISSYVPSLASGVVTALTGTLLQGSTLNYYYVTSGNGEQVSFQPGIMVGQLNYTCPVSTSFNVTTATATVTNDADNVYVDNMHENWNGTWMIYLGLDDASDPPDVIGLIFTASNVTAPAGYAGSFNWGDPSDTPPGNLFWVQVINSAQWYKTPTGGSQQGDCYTYGVDCGYKPSDYVYDSASFTEDSPKMPLPDCTAYQDYNGTDHFSMYMMFQPTGGIAVPVEEVDWNWGGDAVPNGNGGWRINGSGILGCPANGSIGTVEPQWTRFAGNWINE